MTDRKSSWFTLFGGRKFYPFDPNPDNINLEDIALSLSHLCRFNGHCKKFYSVAEHSVHCSHHVSPGHELTALMHDATEAYVGDLIRPIKMHLPDFVQMEDQIWTAVATRFGLPQDMPEAVHRVDNLILVTEARDLLGAGLMEEWGIDTSPIESLDIFRNGREPWAPEEAQRQFLARFEELKSAA